MTPISVHHILVDLATALLGGNTQAFKRYCVRDHAFTRHLEATTHSPTG